MTQSQPTARRIGLLYLAMGLPAPMNLIYFPGRFMIPGDAAASAQRIVEGEGVYRIAILCGFVSNVLFIFLVLSLYNFLKDVDRRNARLMVALVLVSVAIGVVNLLNQVAPLVLLSGADYLSAFTKPQLDALSLGFLRLNGAGNGIGSMFWGLWLFPFGLLVMKSGFIPRFIGAFLILGGFAYIAGSVTSIMWPEHMRAVSKFTLPLAAPGEISILVWLLVRGGRVAIPDAGPSELRIA